MNFWGRVFVTRTGKRSKVWMHDVRVCQVKRINGVLLNRIFVFFVFVCKAPLRVVFTLIISHKMLTVFMQEMISNETFIVFTALQVCMCESVSQM